MKISNKMTTSRLASAKHFQSWFIPEPLLVFGNGNTHIDPKIGLTLYGPLRTSNSNYPSPTSIRVGIVGTGETIGLTNRFLDRLANKIPGSVDNPFLYPEFPGFSKAFDCTIVKSEELNETIPNLDVGRVLDESTFEKMVKKAVELFTAEIENISERIPKPDVIICALPQEIVDHCVVKRTSTGKKKQSKTDSQKKLVKKLKDHMAHNQGFLDDFRNQALKIIEDDIETTNFWRALKVGAMKFGMPTQIAWPNTLETNTQKSKQRQNNATTAWNFSVGLHYKGSGFPWTMTKMKKGTCYVGISFFKDLVDENKMRTSMAQVFTWTGEGLILRGDKFEWDTDNGRTPHLEESAAKELLERAVGLYTKRMGQSPERVVVHKSSKYWEDEKRGFESALNQIRYYDLVAFIQRDMRFFRYGKFPPLRGTAIKLSKTRYLLYTRGYIPYLRTYPGAHVPLPLDIAEHFGDSSPDTILAEIVALTKMNWNSADFSLAKPITIVFSQKVGAILGSLPDGEVPKHEYLYYM